MNTKCLSPFLLTLILAGSTGAAQFAYDSFTAATTPGTVSMTTHSL